MDLTPDSWSDGGFGLFSECNDILELLEPTDTESPAPASQSSGISEWPSSDSSPDGELFPAPADKSPAQRFGKIKQLAKGHGKDAAKDDYDKYDFKSGHCYNLFHGIECHAPLAKVIFEVCKLLIQNHTIAQRTLLPMNRWAKRRMPNAYAWLDRNQEMVTDEELQLFYREGSIKVEAARSA
jgi:hypothetical protein